ncbi:MAG: glycosyltransferase, partial [Clostridiales bacterium]|nr:glycosyltransferase [Clostridiales bacterium]
AAYAPIYNHTRQMLYRRFPTDEPPALVTEMAFVYNQLLQARYVRTIAKLSYLMAYLAEDVVAPSERSLYEQLQAHLTDINTYKEGKAACKKSLQEQLGLEVNPGAPLCVMISRLVDQKGLDLLLYVLDEMLYDGMQIVILGTGDNYYERALADTAARNPGKMCACIDFDAGLAHTMYAAADIFLMPSLFEPCGLSQLVSMAYGTVPVVRETGGLKDTVIPYNEFTGEGNGFSFANINAHEFLFITKYACDLYRNHKDVWDNIIKAGMSGDYSWKKSAGEYAGLYSLITGIPLKEKKEAPKPVDIEEDIPAPKKPAPKKTAKKPAAKKTAAKKPAEKKTAKKPAAKKAPAKKPAEKKDEEKK